VTRNGRIPFRHSLAVTLYGDSLRDSMPLAPELLETITSLLSGAAESGAGSRRAIGARPRSQRVRTPKCK
jgi:hypothetical protein